MSALLVAVVDDEESVRKALGRLLRAAGLDAHCYASGQSFLDAIEADLPSCLVLDLHMPGLNGMEVLERLGDRDPRLPTIVITGHDEPDTETRCLTMGAAAYLRKPVDDHELLQRIDEAVHGLAGRAH